MAYHIIDATLDDIASIYLVLEHYHKECFQKFLTPNTDNAVSLISSYILDEDAMCRLCVKDNKIVGFYLMARDKEFFEEYIAYIKLFYVMPDYRNGRVAMLLAKDLVATLEKYDVTLAMTTSSAGMGKKNEISFKKIMAFVGFEQKNDCLMKIRKEI